MRLKFLLVISCLLIATNALAREHTIEQGDTLARIARKYAVSRADLKKLNRIKDETKLQLGDILIIPDRLIGNARRSHTVKKGDTIAKIASRYKVNQQELRKLNHINKNEMLSLGQILAIPNPPGDDGPSFDTVGQTKNDGTGSKKNDWAGGIKGLVVSGRHADGGILHTVIKGQTLSMISRAYVVDEKKIARKNNINKHNPLKPGMEILIPGAKRPVPVRTAQYKPHSVQFVRIKKTKRMKIKLIRPNGIVHPRGRRALARLMGYTRVRMHPRLAELMQRVAERFPGKAIEIMSGYRPPVRGKKKQSMHAKGRAVDFRVNGVSNALLYEFISSLDDVGAGFYPNSLHVHLDTRDKKYLWTDVSGRGEKANYVEPGETGHFSTIAESITDDGDIVDSDETDEE
ncbi:MAG: LysM peptidoglycan-binding domain-containing protein [Deltaproteobacteria bacterium]|nr:LysM peptidoglycan-binding domain-containing protein [Deltaproteobacteria bacterium]MBN2671249.1 LysM peptidoglycan-binding domain-containing protein [Deltaproteobacteria bacterium]